MNIKEFSYEAAAHVLSRSTPPLQERTAELSEPLHAWRPEEAYPSLAAILLPIFAELYIPFALHIGLLPILRYLSSTTWICSSPYLSLNLAFPDSIAHKAKYGYGDKQQPGAHPARYFYA